MGIAAEAAPAQMNMIARGIERPIPKASSRRKIAGREPPHDAELCETRPGREARKGEDDQRSSHSADADNGEAGAHCGRVPRKGCRGNRERSEGDGVDEAERDERQADTTDAHPAAGVAAHDCDPDHLVEAARKSHAHDRGTAARGGECKRPWALECPEQPAPSVGLEAVSEQEKERGRGEESGICMREGPAGVDERAGGDGEDPGRQDCECERDGESASTRAKNAGQRLDGFARSALKDCSSRKTISPLIERWASRAARSR